MVACFVNEALNGVGAEQTAAIERAKKTHSRGSPDRTCGPSRSGRVGTKILCSIRSTVGGAFSAGKSLLT